MPRSKGFLPDVSASPRRARADSLSQGLPLTRDVVGELERRNALRDVNIEDVVVLFSLEQLFSTRADRVDDLPDLLPGFLCTRPLCLMGAAPRTRHRLELTW